MRQLDRLAVNLLQLLATVGEITPQLSWSAFIAIILILATGRQQGGIWLSITM